MVAIPPRMLFSIIKYISGSVMRSSLAFVYFKADAHASEEGYKMEGVQTMLLVNRVSEIFKDVGQQKNVGEKVMIVVILHSFHVIMSPNFTRPIVILRWARLVF